MSGPTDSNSAVRLRPPANKLDGRVLRWWRARASLLFGPPIVVLAVLALVLPGARWWLLLPAVAFVVVAVPFLTVLPLWWYRLHRWEVTDDAVYVRSGYLWQEWRVAPMSRIQTVDTRRGPLEQAIGLAAVTVTTASAKGAIQIEGLDHEQAAELADELTRITQTTPGDAT